MVVVRSLFAALAAFLSFAAPARAADADPRIGALLDSLEIVHETDADGDYKLVYSYADENRTQQIFVSGGVETVAGLAVREIFSPAHVVSEDGLDPATALLLLTGSSRSKLGAWELHGSVVFFVIKVPDPATAEELKRYIDVAAETADNMEIELTGAADLL